MNTALDPESSESPSMIWSLYAGLYMFFCGIITALLLTDMLSLLADVISLPAEFAMVIFASPALLIGAVTWWVLIEQRGSYSYRFGGLFGLVTALLTGLLWTTRFVAFWGFEMIEVRIVSMLVILVLGMVTIAGVLTGLPFMYARRRLSQDLSSEPVHTV